MIFSVKKDVLEIYHKIKSAGFEVFFVGGCVRDLLLDRTVQDWDLTTNGTPEEIQKLFPDSFYDNSFGTVGISLPNIKDSEHKGILEITTFRTESSYSDNRHPEKVEWGKTIKEDLARRDFTVNAIALSIDKDGNEEIIDPYGGKQDLEKKIIRAVGNPIERFAEDALRLLRAIRIATQLQFEIEPKTWEGIIEKAETINQISKERVRDELLKTLTTDNPYDGVMLFNNAGLLKHIIPELIDGKGISQARPGRHHTTDVFDHNVLSLKHCPSKDPIVRLSTLLHDVGKPSVASTDENGLVIFYNHEVKGAKVASQIADRLRFSKKQREKIYTLIRWHMFTIDEHITDSAIRRFIRRVGIENVNDMIDLRIGDRLGGGTQFAESWRLKKFKERLNEQLNPPFSINDLAVNGRDVMRELNIEPGPTVGKVLKVLFEEVDENLELNNHEYLTSRIHELNK